MSASGQNTVDLDALLDLTEYDSNYQSPSLSPSTTSKPTFPSPVSATVTTPALPASSQTLTGPSHNYDMYRQQTGFVPGALASTMAVNQTNNTGYQDFGSLDYVSNYSPEDDLFDFNTSPSQNTVSVSDIDMDFDSTIDSQQFFSTINPSNIEQGPSQISANTIPQANNAGRLWPGVHSQLALAKAQAQQKQQQLAQQQQAQRQAAQQKPRRKDLQPTDTIVEQKITQLLNSMRAKTSSSEADSPDSGNNLARTKKEEDEMDEDERLLASEEGKKLSSKERRQLRNKVSARAFRSRRKEYITQLESEIATKVTENGDLRAQNRVLMDENKRLADLSRMLLSSPSFSNFLDHLSTDAATVSQPAVIKSEPQQQQDQRQIPKDVNPHNGHQSQQQQIGMAMIPEQSMDFSMLSLDNNAFHFQPQVFVVDTPEVPSSIDTAILSGKSSNFVEPLYEAEKIEIPVIERRSDAAAAASEPQLENADGEAQPGTEFSLFDPQPFSSSPAKTATEPLDYDCVSDVDIFGGIETEKVLAHYNLVNATETEASAAVAMARVQRINANVEHIVSRLELLTMDL